MTKEFEVGKYAINNKGIGIAGPQSTIYKVTALSKKKNNDWGSLCCRTTRTVI